ncbi:hypothetical protein ACLB2K_073943 [Fragaria x ananassa]
MEAGNHQEGAASSSSSSSKTSGSSTTSSSTTSFTSALTLSQLGDDHVPQRYVLPPSQRPISPSDPNLSTLPILDLSSLQSSSLRPHVINNIQTACKEIGFFQVINHGIPLSVMKDALSAANEFFNLPVEDKMLLGSDNVHAPVRYGTSINHAVDKNHFWRDFIKHYSHPISEWIHLWPSNPSSYKVTRLLWRITASLQRLTILQNMTSVWLRNKFGSLNGNDFSNGISNTPEASQICNSKCHTAQVCSQGSAPRQVVASGSYMQCQICMKSGHSAAECLYRHTCSSQQPTHILDARQFLSQTLVIFCKMVSLCSDAVILRNNLVTLHIK